jgi:hypothetical protein
LAQPQAIVSSDLQAFGSASAHRSLASQQRQPGTQICLDAGD